MKWAIFGLRLVLVHLCAGAAFCGCGHTHDLTTVTPQADARTTLQGLEGKDVGVALRSGVQTFGEVKALDSDSLKISAGDHPTDTAIPYLDIQKITVFNHGNAIATAVGIAVGFTATWQVLEHIANRDIHVHVPDWVQESHIPLPVVLSVLGAAIGGTTASQLFPVSDTYVFLSSQPDTVILLVDRLLEDGDKTIRVRIRTKIYTLPTKECGIVRQPDGVCVKASRAAFRKAGVHLQ